MIGSSPIALKKEKPSHIMNEDGCYQVDKKTLKVS